MQHDDLQDVAIHPSAIIERGAKIGRGCKIGAFTIIGANAQIGEESEIGSHCEIGVHAGVLPESPLLIGDRARIRSGSIIYQGSTFGSDLRTGHRVTVREGTQAGEGLQIGTLSDLQGHCHIGDFVRLHSNVHIGQKSSIGNYVWIFPYVVLTNDPHPPSTEVQGCRIEDFAVIATMSTILPGRTVGKDALVGAMSLVRENVPDGMICSGVPGRIVGPTSRVRFRGTDEPVYPWRRHFHRGYPEHVVAQWLAELSDRPHRS